LPIEPTVLQQQLVSIVRRFPQQKIAVVGDAIADQFVYGAIGRVSREAPVFILRHEHTETVPGGAANCAMNLGSLGAQVSLVSATGDDDVGTTLIEKLAASGVDCAGIIRSQKIQTTMKVRILAGQVHSTRQQVIRIDYESGQLTDSDLREELREQVLAQTQSADAVIVSDYNYGVADPEMATFVRDAVLARKIPVLADSRFRLRSLSGFTSATPNQDELEQLLGKQLTNTSDLERAAEETRKQFGYRALLVTRGSQGMMLVEDGERPVHIEAEGALEPVDVTGAGDTVIATYALALASDASFGEAARLANYAGGLVVMKRGTACVTGEELIRAVLR
jgi:rfaE bifunctional protein kinase chain/domain